MKNSQKYLKTELNQQIVETDNIENQIKKSTNVIMPDNTVWPTFYERKINKEINKGYREINRYIDPYDLENNQSASYDYKNIIGLYNTGIAAPYLFDLAAGIYTSITRNELDFQLLKMNPIDYLYVNISLGDVKRAGLGPFATDSGNKIISLAPIGKNNKPIKNVSKRIAETWRDNVYPYLQGRKAIPRISATFQSKKKGASPMIMNLPLMHVLGYSQEGDKKRAYILLPEILFSIKEKKGGIVPRRKVLYLMRGLMAMYHFGNLCCDYKSPHHKIGHRLNLMCHAANQIDLFAKSNYKVYDPETERFLFAVTKEELSVLFPRACRDGRIRKKEIMENIDKTGKAFNTAIRELGIEDELPEQILLPVENNSVDFDKSNGKNHVRIAMKCKRNKSYNRDLSNKMLNCNLEPRKEI